MQLFIFKNVPSVFLIWLVLIVSAQRASNSNLRDLGPQELARQNQITTKILEAYIQKKLGLTRTASLRPPSIFDILPVKKQGEERPTRQLIHQEEEKVEDPPEDEEEVETGNVVGDDERLQSVESEQIDSIYSEGM